MRQYIIILSFITLIASVLQAQQDISTAVYMPAKTGDSLYFQNVLQPESPPILFTYNQVSLLQQTALKRSESTGSNRLEVWNGKGLQLLLLGFSGGRELLFDEPLRLLPPKIAANQTYRDTVPYTLLRKGAKQGTGSIFCEAIVESFISAETPLRNFGNCLVVSYRFVQKPATGGLQMVYEIKEWYAKDIGVVKALGRTYEQDSKGKQTNGQSTAILLQKAYLSGKWLEGRAARK